ncbi:hypothetical protein A0E43_08295 [Pectobacterium cacticida]
MDFFSSSPPYFVIFITIFLQLLFFIIKEILESVRYKFRLKYEQIIPGATLRGNMQECVVEKALLNK